MPYTKKRYESKAKYKKYKRCVKKVKAKDRKVKSPHAVCRAAIYGKKGNPMGYKKVKRKKRGRIVRAVAHATKGGKGKIKKRPAYKKAYPKRGRPKKR